MSENKKNNKKLMWFLEVTVWFLLILVLTSGIMLGKYYYKKSFNSYQIFMQDVDGLIVGSPVKMMGVQVGYVRQVDMVNDLVFIDFIITHKNIKIPKGSKVTVEFNGLGGSKSIEIYTPKRKPANSESYLIVQNPTRIKDALGMLNIIYDKIMSITYRCSLFAEEFNENKIESKKLSRPPKEILNDTDKWLDENREKIENIGKSDKR